MDVGVKKRLGLKLCRYYGMTVYRVWKGVRLQMGDKNQLRKLNMNELDEGLKMRAKAKMMEDEVKVIKAEANEMVEASLAMLGLKDYTVEGIGKVALGSGSNTSMSKEKLTLALVEKGVEPAVVVGAIAKATKTSYYTYVKYTKK
jgi:hypothetical protein